MLVLLLDKYCAFFFRSKSVEKSRAEVLAFIPKEITFLKIYVQFNTDNGWERTMAVALQLSYFSMVSARLAIIQHEQAVCIKSLAPLFECTVCPYQMVGSVAGILGI